MNLAEFHNILDHGPQPDYHRHNANPEHRLQSSMVRWFRLQHTNHMIFAIPNGGKRNVVTAAILKEEGVVAGVPDLLIPEARHGYNCLWIEVKNGTKGKVSDVQQDMHKRLIDHGNKVEVVRTLEQFIDVVNDYFS